jgi:hypothetical protein
MVYLGERDGMIVDETGGLMKRTVIASVAVLVLIATGCSTDATATDEYMALQAELDEAKQEIATAEQALADGEAQLVQITAERDSLIADAPASADRYEKSAANTERVAAIIDDPDAFGTKEEVLDELMALATPEAVMDDTAFGAVPIRQAWSNTLWGSDATIKTWVRWMCDDGSQAGSLWSWIGESNSGKPFELIGVNLDEFDDEGRVTYSLVDWAYDSAYVRESVASGNVESE